MGELLIKIAGAYDEKLGQSEKAVEYYRRAQAIEPDDTTALEALEKLYTRHERWPELLETYRRKVDLTQDASDREAIYFRMAWLWEEMLGNVDEAIATYKEVLGQVCLADYDPEFVRKVQDAEDWAVEVLGVGGDQFGPCGFDGGGVWDAGIAGDGDAKTASLERKGQNFGLWDAAVGTHGKMVAQASSPVRELG